MLVSGVWKGVQACVCVCVCVDTDTYFFRFFSIIGIQLLQIIEYSSLGYTMHPCYLSVLCECSVTSVQSALCDPMDCNPPGSPVHEILQARILERVAISFSRGSSRLRDWTCVSYVTIGIFPTQGLNLCLLCLHWDLPDSGTETVSLMSPLGSSQLRDWTCVSYVSRIGRRVLYR